MLKLLKIKNIALVAAVELEFGARALTLLTGETGAGKSILVDALGLLLGARASADLIRTGEKTATVEAVFERAWIGGASRGARPPVDDDEIILRREVGTAGRARATVNGALVPVAVLRELAPVLAAIHGQHEPQGSARRRDPPRPPGQSRRARSPTRPPSATPYRRLRAVEAALEAPAPASAARPSGAEMLEYQSTEIDRAALEPGEEESLAAEKAVQANAGRLAELSGEAYGALYEDEEAVARAARPPSTARSRSSRRSTRGSRPTSRPRRRAAQLDDLALFLRDYQRHARRHPGRLDEIESRLALIERLKKRHGGTVDEVLAFAERTAATSCGLVASPEERERSSRSAGGRPATLSARPQLRCRKRRKAPPTSRSACSASWRSWRWRRRAFRVALSSGRRTIATTRDWRSADSSRPSSCISPNPGEELRPLARIASGGELSRILLALQSVASLDARGRRWSSTRSTRASAGAWPKWWAASCARSREHHQVLCVTHLPQIASHGRRALRRAQAGGARAARSPK